MNAAEVREALMGRWPVTEYLHIAEAPMHSDRSGRKLDVAVVSMWRSRGLAIDGVEIKVSMSDWKRELDEPDKADWWWNHVDRFWVAAPAEVAKKIRPQLPPGWGLLSVGESGVRASVTPEPNRKRVPFTWEETVGLLRASADFGLSAAQREFNRGRDEGRRLALAEVERTHGADPLAARKLAHAQSELDRLQVTVAAFEEASGVKIGRWPHEAGSIGGAVAVVRAAMTQGPEVVARRLVDQAEQTRRIAEQVDKLRDTLLDALAPAEAAAS